MQEAIREFLLETHENLAQLDLDLVALEKAPSDSETLARAFRTCQATRDRPTLIIVDSHIGYGAPTKQDTHAAHGEPLGEEEIKGAKRNLGWPEDAKFLVPPEVPPHFKDRLGKRGAELRKAWFDKIADYKAKYPALAEELYRMQHRQLPEGWDKDLPVFPADAKGIASRDSSQKVLNALAKNIPWLIGGSADLAPSTKTRLTFPEAGDFSATSYGGRNFHFGRRFSFLAKTKSESSRRSAIGAMSSSAQNGARSWRSAASRAALASSSRRWRSSRSARHCSVFCR